MTINNWKLPYQSVGNPALSGITNPAQSGVGSRNPLSEYMNEEGLFGVSHGTWDDVGKVAGLAGSTYNLYDSIWGNKADLYKEQIGNLRDQRKYNKELMANKRQYSKNIGSGLANAFATS